MRGPDRQPGVWFFTLEAARLIAVLAARVSYHLPYRWARMSIHQQVTRERGHQVIYRSDRRAPFGKATTNIAIEPGAVMQAEPLDHFLTARFRLYAASGSKLAFAPIEHAPWPLQQARVLRLEENLMENSGVPRPRGEPLVHYSEEVTVKAGLLRWL